MSKLLTEPEPCCICGVLMTDADFERQNGIFAGDLKVHVVAHAHHIGKGDTPHADYKKNVEKMALAFAEKMKRSGIGR